MEDLCKIRDVYRAIAEFETQFMQHSPAYFRGNSRSLGINLF